MSREARSGPSARLPNSPSMYIHCETCRLPQQGTFDTYPASLMWDQTFTVIEQKFAGVPIEFILLWWSGSVVVRCVAMSIAVHRHHVERLPSNSTPLLESPPLHTI